MTPSEGQMSRATSSYATCENEERSQDGFRNQSNVRSSVSQAVNMFARQPMASGTWIGGGRMQKPTVSPTMPPPGVGGNMFE